MRTAFIEASDAQAARFLQTLLLIDDGVNFAPTSDKPPVGGKKVVTPTAEALADLRRGRKTDDEAAGAVHVTKTTPKYPIEADRLTEASALRGLICGVIKPRQGDKELAEHVLMAAQKADICILDWNTYDDDGESTRTLITKLIPTNRRDDRYRVVCIYSGEPDAKDKMLSILRALTEVGVVDFQASDSGFAIQRGYTKICWYSKENTQGTKAEKARERPVDLLPASLITEFAAIDRGLMTNFALSALTAVREKTHNVLAKFESKLDPAFLSHRGLQAVPADAEEHLLAVFVSELESVLEEDPKVRDSVNCAAAIERVTDLRDREHVDLAAKCEAGTAEKAMAWISSALADGLQSAAMLEQHPELEPRLLKLKEPKPGACLKYLSKIFRKNAPDDFVIDAEFAMLLSLKSRYPGAPEPILSLGTILQQKGVANSLWLCVQPLCDSIRLPGPRVFPLVKLQASSSPFDIVVRYEGSPKRLRTSMKLYESIFPSFEPVTGCIRPVRNEQEQLEYVDASDNRYIWIAELRLPQALRFSSMIAHESSRIGLTQAEWLRRQSEE